MTARYNAPGQVLPYTDIKLMRPGKSRLDNNQMVEVGQRAGRGETIDEIAAARPEWPRDAIRRYLHPEESTQTKRQKMTNLKRGRRR